MGCLPGVGAVARGGTGVGRGAGDLHHDGLRALVVQRLAQRVVEERGDRVDELEQQAEAAAVPEQRGQAEGAPPPGGPAEAERLVGLDRHRPDPHHPLAEGLPPGRHGRHLIGEPERGGDQQDGDQEAGGLLPGGRQRLGGGVTGGDPPPSLPPGGGVPEGEVPDEPAVHRGVEQEHDREVDQPGDQPGAERGEPQPVRPGLGEPSRPGRVRPARWRTLRARPRTPPAARTPGRAAHSPAARDSVRSGGRGRRRGARGAGRARPVRRRGRAPPAGSGGGGPVGGVASAGIGAPIHPSPSQYRLVSGSAGSTYQPGCTVTQQP